LQGVNDFGVIAGVYFASNVNHYGFVMTSSHELVRCGSHLAGHEVHWIQGLKAANDMDQPAVLRRVVSASDDGALVVDAQGETLSLWNHEPDRLSCCWLVVMAERSACR